VIVWIDTETGGVDPHLDALLEVALIDDETGELFELHIRPDGLACHPEALRINKIDPTRPAVGRERAGELLSEWLEQRSPVVFAGHNVSFDIDFLTPLLDNQTVRVKHQRIDTVSVFAVHGLPLGPLGAVAREFLGLVPKGPLHQAKTDALLAREAFRALRRQPKPSRSAQSQPVLPSLLERVPRGGVVAEQLHLRSALGKVRYGEELHTHNGRDALADYREEILDALQYAHQAYLEGRIDRDITENLLALYV
jgi:DNA polymerase III epsilon subunit-like protein